MTQNDPLVAKPSRIRIYGCLIPALLAVGLAALSIYRYAAAARYRAWTYSAGTALLAEPRLTPFGDVLVSSTDTVLALDARTGAKRWVFTPPHVEEGLFTPVAVAHDGDVYVPTLSGDRSTRLYALDGRTGTLRWSRAEHAGAVYFIDKDRFVEVGFDVTVARKSDGRAIWTYYSPHDKRVDRMSFNKTGAVEALACGPGRIYAAFGSPYDDIVALDAATGRRLWYAPTGRSGPFSGSFSVDLRCGLDGTLYVGLPNGVMRALDPSTAQVRWRLQYPSEVIAPSILPGPDGTIYLGWYCGAVTAVDPHSGAKKWEKEIGEGLAHLALGPDGELLAGTRVNGLVVLDARTGAVKRRLGFGWLRQLALYGNNLRPTTAADGMVYGASTDGRLYALRKP